ncbi:MAG TPA: hypothetical protein VE287_01590, partial [Actinopolymorphaceae bacterium]|nr:hypothetical protein [Actinopolymorphaceae bacterium]
MHGISRRTLLQRTGILALGGAAAGSLPGIAGPARAAQAGSTSWVSGDITFALRSLTAKPGAPPSGSSNVDRAWTLLTDGLSGGDSVGYDFNESTPTANRYVDITASFVAPADVRSVRLTALVPDADYDVASCVVSFVALDGTITKATADLSVDEGVADAIATLNAPRTVKSVVVRTTTTKRLLLDEIVVTGAAHGLVNITLTDPAAFHVHAPGQAFEVDVLPEVVAFGDVTHLLQDLTLTPGTQPFATQHVDQARALLTDGKTDYVPDVGVLFDFWGTPEDLRYVDVAVTFPSTSVSSVTLDHFTMNGEYGVTKCTVTLVGDGGDTTTKDASLTTAGGLVTAQLVLPEPIVATSVVARIFTPYKLNLTELSLTGATRSGLDLPDPELRASWKGFQGNRLSSDVDLTVGVVNTVMSPPHPGAGYYGLEFSAATAVAFSDHLPGERREYGFAVTDLRTVDQRNLNPASTCGMVHDDISDPYIGGWSKNTSWQTGTFDADAWHSIIQSRRGERSAGV